MEAVIDILVTGIRFSAHARLHPSYHNFNSSTSVNNAGIHLLEIDLVIVMLVLIVFLKMVLAKREGIEMLLQEVMIGMEREGQREMMEEATGTGLALMIVRAWEVARLHLTAINNCYAGSTFRLKQYA